MRTFTFIIIVIISLAGLLSPIPPPPLFKHIGFVLHCSGFIVLSLTARLTFFRAPAPLVWSVLLIAAPAAEFLQILQPTRGFSRMDIVANLTGVVLAAITWMLLSYLYRSWQHRHTN